MPPLTLQEEGLTKEATTPPTGLWNAPHKAAPACDLGRHDRGHPAHVWEGVRGCGRGCAFYHVVRWCQGCNPGLWVAWGVE